MIDNVTTKRVFCLGWVTAITLACSSCGDRASAPCAPLEDFPQRFSSDEGLLPTPNWPFTEAWSESDREELRVWAFSLLNANGIKRALRGEELPEISLVAGVREEVRGRLKSNDDIWGYSIASVHEPEFIIVLFSILVGSAPTRLEDSMDFTLAVGESCNWETLNYVASQLIQMANHDDRVFTILRERMQDDWVVNTVWREVIAWNQDWHQWIWYDEDEEKLSGKDVCGILQAWILRLSKLEEHDRGNLSTVEALLDWNQSGELPALLSGMRFPIEESDALVTLIRKISRND